ncbi:outer membrane beta-barrel protein [Mangrovibacterium lignilyticum]|uniref:outer membrane beta-barrel protein n=1 Tax=Mangrovibacterium lignilyticum TaxID=2668052 RepID=UPI0013D308C1|nr:outer membrane beta-barrel protein [Mangrovibacterium lignilyticum]
MEKTEININHLRLFFQIAVIISLTFFCHVKSKAQIAFVAGGNYSNIRSNVSLENKKPILGYNFGVSVQYYPFKKFQNISLLNELEFVQKGYQQDFTENYSFRFNYLSFPVLINYSLSTQISIQAGIELSTLISTNIEQGTKTYNNFDTGLALGIICFGEKRISCYSRFTYGLLPMLNYYQIDEIGNFKNEIHDLKNICLSIGIKVNLYNEKILLHKN